MTFTDYLYVIIHEGEYTEKKHFYFQEINKYNNKSVSVHFILKCSLQDFNTQSLQKNLLTTYHKLYSKSFYILIECNYTLRDHLKG